MATLPPSSKPPRRRPSLRGVLQQDIVNGKERARSWPRPRGKRGSKAERENRERFRWIQFASKFYDATAMAAIMDAVRGTPLLPRDIFTMMMTNRLFAIEADDGKVYYPMTIRTEVEQALDSITQTVGMFLMKTAEGWAGVAPPEGGSGGGAPYVLTPRSNGNQSAGAVPITRGNRFDLVSDFVLTGISVIVFNAPAVTPVVFSVDSSDNLVAELWRGPEQTLTASLVSVIPVPALELPAGARYAVLLISTLTGQTWSFPTTSTVPTEVSIFNNVRGVNWNTDTPDPGDSLVMPTGTAVCQNMTLIGYVPSDA